MVRMYKRANGKLYLEYQVDGKTIQKSTGLQDTPKNRTLVKKEVIPILEKKIIMNEISLVKPKDFKYYSKILLKNKEHLKSYEHICHIIDVVNITFGDKRIDTINRGMIKDWVHHMLNTISPKTVKDYLTQIRGVFNVAIDFEIIKDNAAENIPLPKHIKKDIEPFSSKEVTTLLNNANDWYKLFLAISFYTGIRTGEALALMRSDIDLKNRVIHIRRSMSDGKLSTPKTEGSIRTVPILNDLVPYLRKLPKTMWLFPQKNGNLYARVPGQKKVEWKKLLSDCDMKYRKLYATRHTFIVSMLKNSNLSILEIAQIAGHNSTQMIIQNYARFIKGEHLKIDREIKLFESTDNYTDSIA